MYFDVEVKHESTDWKAFEKLVHDIFESFGYKTEADVRFKTVRRFQVDVIAYDGTRCFFVDCKDHAYIPPSEEDEFIRKQKIRAENLVKLRPELEYKRKIILLVTRNKSNSLLQHSEASGKILGVDINGLKELLINLPVYEDELLSL
ncbi:MAG: restriction endonuclease [Candidatus Parvarchaeota archaeon]|nr:restriction endonuclease [Candidatus Parvarchaeota archaeon]